jgi:hypothetical protein
MAMTAAYRVFKEDYVIPELDFPWDDAQGRMMRYAMNAAYYNNTVYRNINRLAPTLRQQYALYKHIRGVYNPVARLVDLYVANVYGGTIDYEMMSKGAIPLFSDGNDTLLEAIQTGWRWSNWQTQKSLFVRNGAQFGDAAIWIQDDLRRSKARMEVVHPAKIKGAEFDDSGNVKKVEFEYRMSLPDVDKGREFAYGMIVDKEWFVTLKDGNPYPFMENSAGEMVPEWKNEYGFVPLVIVQHKDVGQAWGASAFHSSIHKINEINDAASMLNDNIRKSVNVVWYYRGVSKSSDITVPGQTDDATRSTDATSRKDVSPALYNPDKDAPEPFPMVFPVDIADANANILQMMSELENDLPELALHRLRQIGGNLSGVSIRNLYTDARSRFTEARGNYDDGLVRANQMMVAIGGYRGYNGFAGLGLDSYERGDLDHFIKDRPIFEDALTKQERIQVLGNLPEQPEQARLVLKELDVPDDDIKVIVNEIAQGANLRPSSSQNFQFGEEDLNALAELAVAPAASAEANGNV